MALLRFILRSAGHLTAAVVLVGLVASASNAGVLATIHAAAMPASGAVPADSKVQLAMLFMAAVGARIASTYASGALLARYAQDTTARLRATLVTKLMTVPLARLQKIGAAHMLAALTDDLMRIQLALQATASALVNGAVIVGGSVYLLYLSPALFAGLLAVGTACTLAHLIFLRMGRRLIERARDLDGRLFDLFQQLTGGLKELKLNAERRRAFLRDGVVKVTEALKDTRAAAQRRYLMGQATTQLLIFGGIFGLLFVAPRGEPGADSVVGYVLAALYLIGPISSLLRAMPTFAMASVAMRRIERTGAALGRPDPQPLPPPADMRPPPGLTSIVLRDACYSHGDFALGPVSLTIQPGQITFVTGKNGSGKSTLALLLCGLYAPSSGTVEWNETPVDDRCRDRYRQLFSAVFFDFHLFKELWGLPKETAESCASTWLPALQLEDKLSISGGSLSTVDLSQGQRRRAALLIALLEDRPVYLFDEFTADQDPDLRRWFYEELIVDLRAAGKAVVVVTHDDRFFAIADQHLVLDHGRPHWSRADPQGD
ncbi:MAG: cyclic peptide export ABC transporter [Myxococcales bacterium]|nr:cyclic peptide export ABC transporter [Myxococcales bacterium]MDD9970650.1 cyclic peptide export ABC transporter [Myxococcales bacterium]